jgi:curved DNA-binding protein CbpA
MLGVSVGASAADITKAWRRKMLASHPDKNGGSEESLTRSKALNDAKDRALALVELYKRPSMAETLRHMQQQEENRKKREEDARKHAETQKRKEEAGRKQEEARKKKEEDDHKHAEALKIKQEADRKQAAKEEALRIELEFKRKLELEQALKLLLKQKQEHKERLAEERKQRLAEERKQKQEQAERNRQKCENARKLRLIEDEKKRAEARQVANDAWSWENKKRKVEPQHKAEKEDCDKKKCESECVQEFLAHARGNEGGLDRLKGVCYSILEANCVPRERLESLLNDASLYRDGWTRCIKRCKV